MAESPTDTSNVLNECVDIEGFAALYRISRARVFSLIKDEGLPSMKFGRKRIIHVPSADEWLKAKLSGTA